MAIAASQADMARLGALNSASKHGPDRGQGQDCAFGCHFDANNDDFYGVAKANGIPLRIDVLSQAVQGVIDTIDLSPASSQFQIELYSFNAALNTAHQKSWAGQESREISDGARDGRRGQR